MSRKIFLIIFFSLQLAGIIYARFTEVRYFCWAPYDQISLYEIQVRLSHNLLSQKEIQARYHIPAKGRENRSIHNIMSLIEQYERNYKRTDVVEVKLRYSTNGKPQKTWKYPQ